MILNRRKGYYLIEQTNATGNGSETTYILVQRPKLRKGGIQATMVGECVKLLEKNGDFTPMFRSVNSVTIFVIGNAICKEHEPMFQSEGSW